MSYIWPSDAQWDAVRADLADAAAITMLNLLKYRERAAYDEQAEEPPCSGREAYARYAQSALPCVEAFGGRLVFSGRADGIVIGPPTEAWDEVLLVEYPSARAFVEMLESERYRAFAHHRTAALEDSRLIRLGA